MTLNYLSDGNIFGEMAVIDSGPRSATVTAIVDTLLLHLNKDAFHQVVERIPSCIWGIIGVLNEHLRNRVKDMRTTFDTIQQHAHATDSTETSEESVYRFGGFIADTHTSISAEAHRMLGNCIETTTRERFNRWLDSGWLKPQAMIWLLSILSWRQAETLLLWICPQTQGSIQAVAHEMQIGRDTVNTHRRNARIALEEALELEFPVGRGAQASIYDWAVKLDLLDPYVKGGCFQSGGTPILGAEDREKYA